MRQQGPHRAAAVACARPSPPASAPPRWRRARRARTPGRSRSRWCRACSRIRRPAPLAARARARCRRGSPARPRRRTPRRAARRGRRRAGPAAARVFASSSPCRPDQRAESTPGMPLSASTVSPESSATAGRPVCRTASRALSSAFSSKVAPVSGASGYSGDVAQADDLAPRGRRPRAAAAARRACRRCGWPAAAVRSSAPRASACSRVELARSPRRRGRAARRGSSGRRPRPRPCPAPRRSCRRRCRRRSCRCRRARPPRRRGRAAARRR